MKRTKPMEYVAMAIAVALGLGYSYLWHLLDPQLPGWADVLLYGAGLFAIFRIVYAIVLRGNGKDGEDQPKDAQK